MVSSEIHSKLAEYWRSEKVECLKASVGGVLFGTEFAELYELVGMPRQEWWQFRFIVPSAVTSGTSVIFGKVFANWKLNYRPAENVCLYVDEETEHLANSNFVAFMKCLVLYDKGCKRIQRECPGDSGEEWERGDVIIKEMETSMRLIDPRALEEEANLWPYLFVDING